MGHRSPLRRRRYLALATAGVGVALSGCAAPGGDDETEADAPDGPEPSEPAAQPPAADDEEPEGDDPHPARLRVRDVSIDGDGDEPRPGFETPVRIEAVVPVLHGEYEVLATVEFRRDEQVVSATTARLEGRRETTYSREGAEVAETVAAETPTRVAGPFDVVVVLEDTRGPASATATGRAETSIRRSAWQRRLDEAETALDDALEEFRDAPDGTILDAGFDSFAYLQAIRSVRDAEAAVEAAAEQAPEAVEIESIRDAVATETELVERIVRIHRDLVDVFDEIATLQERVDSGTTTGRLRRSIEETQEAVESELERAETTADELFEIADPDELRSARYDEKLDQLAGHLTISRDLVGALTQFQRAVGEIEAARDAHGLGKRTAAERAIRRLDAFVHGVDPDGTPHESIDELLGGVAHLDAHESVEPLIDAIVEMADDRESTARDLRQEGLDEAE